MRTKLQLIAFLTLARRETIRIFRIPSQTFLPPVITSSLYFIIFGAIVGKRLGTFDGYHYNTFIAPGLIMLAVITNAYSNVASSLYIVRFQKSVEEMLVSPMHWSLLLLGYVLGGIVRGLIVGLLVIGVSYFFADLQLNRLPLTLLVIILVSGLFAMAGFLNGMLANTFDEVAFVPTFVLSPLIYLGGVFYTLDMLPDFWQQWVPFNPIFHMISMLRYAMLNSDEINISVSLSVICSLLFVLGLVNAVLIKKGIGLRE